MVEMPYLRTTSDDANAILTEISKKCYLGSGRFWVHLPGNVVENGVVSED